MSWRYVGDALPEAPSWAAEGAGLWAPDSAIGVATSRHATGPWQVSETPVVAPRRNGPGCDFFWTYDPDVLGDSIGARSTLYYGSYYGGVHASIWETGQTEFAKEVPEAPAAYPRYGNTVVGAPSEWTHLRIVKRTVRSGDGEPERYTAYTSQDGRRWVRGGTWTHRLGAGARIGLVSMGGTGFTAEFDHVRVWRRAR